MRARALLAAVALAACAWYALGIRAARDQSQVAALASQPRQLSPAQASQALRRLDDAAALNPDGQLQILRAEVVQRRGDRAQEVRILRRLLAAEPRNIDAWLLLQIATLGHDDALASIAGAHVRALAPPVAPAP